jgi:hypothetical protein
VISTTSHSISKIILCAIHINLYCDLQIYINVHYTFVNPDSISQVFYVQFAYRIAGHFRGVQFSRMASLQKFRSLIFADAGDHAHYTLYNRTYFTGLIFVDSRLSAETGYR